MESGDAEVGLRRRERHHRRIRGSRFRAEIMQIDPPGLLVIPRLAFFFFLSFLFVSCCLLLDRLIRCNPCRRGPPERGVPPSEGKPRAEAGAGSDVNDASGEGREADGVRRERRGRRRKGGGRRRRRKKGDSASKAEKEGGCRVG
uniref:Transmembrane protein n=1 Tax=Leersia perrieri TaxID=77586 RepID=A0A0D9UZ03_9ORYZ